MVAASVAAASRWLLSQRQGPLDQREEAVWWEAGEKRLGCEPARASSPDRKKKKRKNITAPADAGPFIAGEGGTRHGRTRHNPRHHGRSQTAPADALEACWSVSEARMHARRAGQKGSPTRQTQCSLDPALAQIGRPRKAIWPSPCGTHSAACARNWRLLLTHPGACWPPAGRHRAHRAHRARQHTRPLQSPTITPTDNGPTITTTCSCCTTHSLTAAWLARTQRRTPPDSSTGRGECSPHHSVPPLPLYKTPPAAPHRRAPRSAAEGQRSESENNIALQGRRLLVLLPAGSL